MTNQEKKAELQKYQMAVREERRLEDEITRWYSKAERVTTIINQVPSHGGDGRNMENAMDEVDELKNELAEKLKKTVRVRRSIEDAISDVQDSRLQALLKYRYIENMTWERIAVELNVTYQWVCSLHGKALNKILFT